MATPSPVRLLIADLSENRAHEIDSVLRDAGISTRPQFFSDLSAATEYASIEGLDLMLCNAGFDQLGELLPRLRSREPDLPIIVHDDAPEAANLSRGMSLGATDVIFRDDNERLLQVVRRELHHVCRRHRLIETDRALKEAERRCELLLSSSTAAIAYVHEGMHIYANDDYLRLFGFEDADDLLGLPLLDLVDPDHADEIKAQMKAIQVVAVGAVTAGASDDGEGNLVDTGGADDLTIAFRGRTLSDEPVEGDLTLSRADYEGEPCIQVLVRSGASSAPATATSTPANGSSAPVETGTDAVAEFLNRVKPKVDEVERATLLVIEIDDFNELQAEHGLSESKSIVAEIGRWFDEDLSDVLVERIADHRFGVIAFGSEAGGDVLAEQLRAQVEDELFEVNGKTIRCTVTIGAVTVTPAAQLGESVDLAFKAMLASRETKGTNSVLWYQPKDMLVPLVSRDASMALNARSTLSPSCTAGVTVTAPMVTVQRMVLPLTSGDHRGGHCHTRRAAGRERRSGIQSHARVPRDQGHQQRPVVSTQGHVRRRGWPGRRPAPHSRAGQRGHRRQSFPALVSTDYQSARRLG